MQTQTLQKSFHIDGRFSPCADSFGDFSCTCDPGWTGELCDVQNDSDGPDDPCHETPCLGGQTRKANVRSDPKDQRCSYPSPKYEIGVHAVRASDDDGSKQAEINADQIKLWLDRSNEIFAKANIEFIFDGTIQDLADTKVNNAGLEPDVDHIKTKLNGIAMDTGKVVICFRYGGKPGNGFSWTDIDYVIMPGFYATWLEGVQNIGLPVPTVCLR